ncbi:MAG: serine acetyltransferase [Chitinophagaceae bacterium]
MRKHKEPGTHLQSLIVDSTIFAAMGTWALIKSDYRKIRKYGENFFSIVLLTQGFSAMFQYRIANRIYYSKIPWLLRRFLQVFMLLWQKWIEVTTGICIPASVKIGHSFYIAHFGAIIMNRHAVFGNNCNISQGVTIGVSGRGVRRGVPQIGDNVYIGANAVVVGNIKVGHNVLIAANSLVNTDVPDNAVVMGVPGDIINYKGSEGYI